MKSLVRSIVLLLLLLQVSDRSYAQRSESGATGRRGGGDLKIILHKTILHDLFIQLAASKLSKRPDISAELSKRDKDKRNYFSGVREWTESEVAGMKISPTFEKRLIANSLNEILKTADNGELERFFADEYIPYSQGRHWLCRIRLKVNGAFKEFMQEPVALKFGEAIDPGSEKSRSRFVFSARLSKENRERQFWIEAALDKANEGLPLDWRCQVPNADLRRGLPSQFVCEKDDSIFNCVKADVW